MYTKDGFHKALEQKLGDDAYLLLAAGGHKKLADLLTSASLGASGNNTTLSITVGGTTKSNSITVPYASKAGTWETERTLTIGSTGKSVNGSKNVTWSLDEIGVYSKTTADDRYVNVTGDTMSGSLGFGNDNTKFLITTGNSGSASPLRGNTLPATSSSFIGIFARPSKSTDEGGILLSEDTCIVYNSHDTGAGFLVVDTDLSQADWSVSNAVSFKVTSDHTAWSLSGFVKSGSDNSYVLLGGGGHKTESSLSVNYAASAGSVAWGNVTGKPSTFTPSSHTHNYIKHVAKVENECIPEDVDSFQSFRCSNSTTGFGDGYIMAQRWVSGSYITQLFTDVDANYALCYRYRDSGGTWASWKRIPMDDGTGASGTWPISISGNADTVDSMHASQFLQRLPWWTSGNGNNINNIVNGTTFAYTNHNAPTNGVFVAFSGTHDSYQLQLQGQYNGENLWFRNKNGDNGTWNAWRYVIHSGNIGSQSVNYANSAGSATYATNATRLYASDSPYRYGDSAPYYAYFTYNDYGDNRWYMRVSPATPSTIRVDYAGSAGNADTVDGWHGNQLVPKQHSSRFYPFVNSSYGQPWYKITLPWAGYTSGSNSWMMTTMELILGGSYSSGNNGRIYLQYYFYKNTSNAWSASDVRGTTIGYRIIENGVTIKYDIANPGIFYIKANANIYNSIGLENITANDTAPNFDFRNTTIEAIAESSVPSAANQTVPLYHTITTQNGYWANLAIQTSSSTSTYPQFGSLSVINDSQNNGTDGLVYFRHYSNNDWGLIVDKSQSYTYGVDIRAGGAYALKVGNGNTRLIGATIIGEDTTPSYTLDVRGNTRSTGRIYANEWIEFAGFTGLYCPNANGAHWYPNNVSSYGTWMMQGSRGGYAGIQLGASTSYMTLMDSATHKGLYQEGQRWIFYYNRDSQKIGIRDSSTTKDINLIGQTYISSNTWIGTTSGGEMLNVGGWVGTVGNTGWYSITHGGGMYMEDTTYVRVYNSKNFYVSSTSQHAIYTAGGFASAHTSGYVLSTYYNGSWYGDTIYNHGNGNLSIDAPGGSLFLAYYRGNAYFCGGTYYINRSGYFNGTSASAGNADTVDSYHASGLFETLSFSGSTLTVKIGGTQKTCTISTGSTVSKSTSCGSTRYVVGTDSTSGNFTTAYCCTQFYFTTSGAYHTSDIRKKYDIRDIYTDEVTRLFNTDNAFIRHFKWKDTNHDAYGFIAQELVEYCPEAVDLNNDTGYYAVNYNVAFSKIIGAMYKRIKDLERRLEEKENH